MLAIVGYLAERNPAAARALLAAFRQALAGLRAHPEAGRRYAPEHPAFEGVRLAIKQGGSGPLTPAKIKAGLESLKGFDSNGLIAPVTVTAKDHGGGGKTRIDMWDGTKWVPQSDWIAAYTDEVEKVVKEQSAEFAKTQK